MYPMDKNNIVITDPVSTASNTYYKIDLVELKTCLSLKVQYKLTSLFKRSNVN